MVVINVKIVSMSKDAYYDSECGFVRCGDGVFTQVGNMCDYSPVHGEEVVDGKGLTLYPGFIDAHCHLGMWNDALCFEGEDGNEDTDPSTPHLRAIDSVNPMDRCFEDAVNAGVTSVCTGVGSANPIGGSFIIMKTWGSKRVDKLIVKSPAAIKFALGENPKNTYNDRDETPVTRMATAAIIREQLIKAKRYSEDIAEYERLKGTEDEISRPDFDIKCEALLPLFDKEHPLKAHFHCHRADDIFTAQRLANEFGLDYVLIHCTDGALIADELAEDSPAIVLGPIFGDRGKPELANHDISTPAVTGLLRPRLLLPHERYDVQELRYILRHELCHLKRRDMLLKLVLLAANAMHWFNPVVYLMLRQADEDIELACDSAATDGLELPERAAYSRTLLAAVQSSVRALPATTCFGGTVERLKRRITNVLGAQKKRGLGIVALVLALTLTAGVGRRWGGGGRAEV